MGFNSQDISHAADRIESAAHRIALIFEHGYGGTALQLIELLEARNSEASELDRLRAENAALRAELMMLLARLRRGVAVTATEASMRLETLAAAKPAENGAGGA